MFAFFLMAILIIQCIELMHKIQNWLYLYKMTWVHLFHEQQMAIWKKNSLNFEQTTEICKPVNYLALPNISWGPAKLNQKLSKAIKSNQKRSKATKSNDLFDFLLSLRMLDTYLWYSKKKKKESRKPFVLMLATQKLPPLSQL